MRPAQGWRSSGSCGPRRDVDRELCGRQKGRIRFTHSRHPHPLTGVAMSLSRLLSKTGRLKAQRTGVFWLLAPPSSSQRNSLFEPLRSCHPPKSKARQAAGLVRTFGSTSRARNSPLRFEHKRDTVPDPVKLRTQKTNRKMNW